MDDTSSRCICCIEFSDSCSIWINGRKYSRWICKTRHQFSTRKNCRTRSCWTKSKLLRLIFCHFKIATSQCHQFTCTLNNKRNIRFLTFYLQFNSRGTRRVYPHGTRWQCTAKTFYYGVLYAYRLKQTWVMYFQCPRKSIRGLKNAISGHFLVLFLGYFYNIKRFVFEFQGEPFFSYRTHFRRYQHFRGFWQSTASSYRDC